MAPEKYLLIGFDLEYTGSSRANDYILEIGAQAHLYGKEKTQETEEKKETEEKGVPNLILSSQFSGLGQPPPPKNILSDLIIDLTGITQEMINQAPPTHTLILNFLSWLKALSLHYPSLNLVLIAHNFHGDLQFLYQGLLRMGFEPEKVFKEVRVTHCLCTYHYMRTQQIYTTFPHLFLFNSLKEPHREQPITKTGQPCYQLSQVYSALYYSELDSTTGPNHHALYDVTMMMKCL